MSQEKTIATHTPGPWKIADYKSNDIDIIDANGRVIAAVNEWNDEGANARLIAESPDLLRVLENLMQFQNSKESAEMEQAIAVIEKIRGTYMQPSKEIVENIDQPITNDKQIDLATTIVAQGPSLIIDTRHGMVVFEANDIMVTDGKGGYDYFYADAHGKNYEEVKKEFWKQIKEECPQECKVTFRKSIVNDSVRHNHEVPDMRQMLNFDNIEDNWKKFQLKQELLKSTLDKFKVSGIGTIDGDNGTPHPISMSIYANNAAEAEEQVKSRKDKNYTFHKIESIEILGERNPIDFAALNKGDKFDFIDDRQPMGGNNSFFKRCEKISSRKYKDDSDVIHEVGTVKAKVYHVERTQEKSRGMER